MLKRIVKYPCFKIKNLMKHKNSLYLENLLKLLKYFNIMKNVKIGIADFNIANHKIIFD